MGLGAAPADVLFLVDMPTTPSAGWRAGSAEDRLVRGAIRDLSAKVPSGVTCHLSYAISRPCDEPLADDIAAAKTRLAGEMPRIAPKVIVAMGSAALESLGMDGRGGHVPGSVIEATPSGCNALVVPVGAPRDIVEQPGGHFAFLEALRRAVSAAAGWDRPWALEELAAGYLAAQTPAEAERACDACLRDQESPLSISLVPAGPEAVAAVGFAWGEGKAAAIPLRHPGSTGLEIGLPLVARVLASPRPKLVHDAKAVVAALELALRHRLDNVTWDTLAAQHLLTEDLGPDTKLADLVRMYLPQWATARRSRAPAAKPFAELLRDAAVEADMTFRIARIQAARLDEQDATGRLRGFVQGWSVPVARFLASIQHGGIAVDEPLLVANVALLRTVAGVTRRYLAAACGRPAFNPDSPAEVAAALDALGVPPLPATETDRPSVAEESLAPVVAAAGLKVDHLVDLLLADLRPPDAPPAALFAATMIAHAKATKAGLVHLDGLRRLIGADGRVHPELRVNGAVTGRLSSGGADGGAGVNFQNLCRDGALEAGGIKGVSVRAVLRASSPEKVLVHVDVKAAEVRCLTPYTRDELLIRCLVDGQDPHSAVASEVFGDGSYDDYMAAHEGTLADAARSAALSRRRTQIKRVVFGTIYGSGAYGIAQRIYGVDKPEQAQIAEAQRVIDRIHARMPSLAEFVEGTKREVNSKLFVENLLGRRRRFPELTLDLPPQGRARRHRQALNFKIQSLASDLLVGQLAELDPHLGELGGRSLLTVHDSGLFEIERARLGEVGDFFRHWITGRIRERYPWMPVPFEIDIEAGEDYGHLAPLREEARRGW